MKDNTSEPKNFKSGYVAILGKPNVGKSTLLNKLIGRKIAIVSPRPQTTRNRISGIKNLDNAQLIFIDTPGIQSPDSKLNRFMMRESLKVRDEADISLYMIEATESPVHIDDVGIKFIRAFSGPVILLINKIDLLKNKNLVLPLIESYASMFNFKEIIPISALEEINLDKLMDKMLENIPAGPKFFPDDIITEQAEEFFISEVIREKIIFHTYQEIPYCCAVKVTEFKEVEKKDMLVIRAVIFVEGDSQKGILIGSNGKMLKDIGTSARKELEGFFGCKIFLELWVQVKEKWRRNDRVLRSLGYL